MTPLDYIIIALESLGGGLVVLYRCAFDELIIFTMFIVLLIGYLALHYKMLP